ncbi:MAG TPA: hypothetical protein VNL16_04190 [Chloroflexota bacterium]|nr:hypothetical protein [Chloroflexota bacterium]
MTPDQISQAIANSLSDGGEQLLEGTLAAILPILWLMMLALHLARPYMLNVVQKFSLRLGADIWWLAYVAIRDFVILLTFALSFMFFFPDVMTSKDLPVTGPFAALCLFAVLVVKLVRDVDEDLGAFQLTSTLLGIGALLYLIPTLLGVQAGQTGVNPALAKALISQDNPTFALIATYISLLGVGLLGLYAAMHTLRSTSVSSER